LASKLTIVMERVDLVSIPCKEVKFVIFAFNIMSGLARNFDWGWGCEQNEKKS